MKRINRIFACCLAVALIVLAVPFAGTVAQGYSVKLSADGSTMDSWQDYFGIYNASTENAGTIWLDKSVFTDASAFPENTVKLDKEGNVLVALSALSANKTITGYDNLPTDTIFVLDVSLSMRTSLDELIASANTAMKSLLHSMPKTAWA
ncbi:MAG: hypothetical protein IJY88_04015 [Clostridia bacterium]|nr:hypothetical protein [Clostridia bacterium]